MQRTVDPKNQFNITKRFDSFAEYLAHVDEPGCPEDGSSREEGNESYRGTPSFDAAMELARNGWPEGLTMIERLTAKLENVTASLVSKQVVQWDVAGDFADAGLFSAGVPECMGSFHEEIAPGVGKCVRILYNISASCGASCESLMKRGAAVCALIDALESAGRSCEVIVAARQEQRRENYTVLLPIKEAGEALELDRIAFILAHPSSYRRIMFSCFENEAPEVRKHFGFYPRQGYGRPERHTDESADINVPQISLFDRDESQSLAWIRTELQRQGCTMEETPA